MRSIILHVTEEDRPYLTVVKPLIAGRCSCAVDFSVPVVATEMCIKSRSRGISTIVSTSEKLLSLVFPFDSKPKISEYAGSFITYDNVDFLFVNPLDTLVTTATGKFIFSRFLSKILAPEDWLTDVPFKWELYTLAKHSELLEWFGASHLIAIDIETLRDDPDRSIECVGYTAVRLSGKEISLRTVVVPLDTYDNIAFVRAVNSNNVAKALQNGKYDLAYFFRYNLPVQNYSFDTINLFHSWLSELPKDLGFISSFMLRKYRYHKNDGKSGDKTNRYQYNALDCYVTALTCLALLIELPEYAVANFLQEFPVVFPSHLMEMTGIKWDKEAAAAGKEKVEKDLESELRKLRMMVACPTYNPASSPQTVRLFALLGSKDIIKTTPPDKDKVASRHPLNARIVSSIINYRENAKLNSSYYKEGVEWNGRCFYAVNPHGTDTGRLASRESQYWCGLQIQNIPRDGDAGDVSIKESFVSDEEFFFGEADYAQAEARDTAYLSGDTSLIAAVDDESRDFHGTNASAFFGLPYEQIVRSFYDEEEQEWIHKVVNKAIRNTAKRTNHGANYNMTAPVLLDTMGIEAVLLAKKLLQLPKWMEPVDVCAHLLKCYDKTYPVVRGPYYEYIRAQIKATGFLVGPTGWTRRCFNDPSKNKRAMNMYAAHPSQSLNAMTLNKAVVLVYQKLWMREPQNFKLCAQIHDSLLFQYREGHEHLAWEVKELMTMTIPVKDSFGITRDLTVPVDLKGGAKRWSDLKSLKKSQKKNIL